MQFSLDLSGDLGLVVAMSGAVTFSARGRAVTGLGKLPVGSNTSLGVEAPEISIVGARHRRIWLSGNELTLPPQRCAKVGVLGIEAFLLVEDHAAPLGES